MAFRVFGPLLAVAAIAAAGAALACSCIRYPDAATQLERTDVMFIGRAGQTTLRDGEFGAMGTTSFTVERTLKGPAMDVREVEHFAGDAAMCGVHFQRGRTYTVLASVHEGRLRTDACSGAQFSLQEYERALSNR